MKTMKFLGVLLLGLLIVSCEDKGKGGEGPELPPVESVEFSVASDGNAVTVTWTSDKAVDIWRSVGSGQFAAVAKGLKQSPYADQVSEAKDNDIVRYRVVETGGSIYTSEVMRGEKKVRICLLSDEELLDLVQKQTLKYFFDFAHPSSKMARERNASGDVVTTGGTGFGVMALIAGAERGFISRGDAFSHIRAITDFLMRVPRFHGAYAHWYNGATGAVQPFSSDDDGGDLVETALLMQGLLTAKEYFGEASASAEEKKLADDIDELWRGVEWSFYTQNKNSLTWHWSANYGFQKNLTITGWNECLITYVLAASSPTFPITKEVYTEGFTRNGGIRNGHSFYGTVLPVGDSNGMGGPLFFAHYSFLGLDPRGLKDEVCDDYFEQNKAHTLINRAYCIKNPKEFEGYSSKLWGLTASDCPVAGYTAHSPGNDNGTVSPTAALSSMPYTPEESMEVLEYLYREAGMLGEYGFYDAINLSVDSDKQIEKSFLAIDQGPIVVMIENYRSQLLWNTFMKNEDVKRGLKKLGFSSPRI